jgi:hypothetical protein
MRKLTGLKKRHVFLSQARHLPSQRRAKSNDLQQAGTQLVAPAKFISNQHPSLI